jgi:HAE1 family hydrophobic/amphiphilic exporter-1
MGKRLAFDQWRGKPHHVKTMNKTFAVSLLASAAFTAGAQTAANTPAGGTTVRELSLKDCIQQALAQNFDVQISRYNPIVQQYTLNAAYGGYDPLLSLSGLHSHNNAVQFTTTVLPDGTSLIIPNTTLTDNDTFKTSIAGTSPVGTVYSLFGNIDQGQQSQADRPEQQYSGGQIGLNVTQPLLKNFWIDENRLTIDVAKNNLAQSEQGFRLQLITTVAAVQIAYYELIFARQNIAVQQEALTLAQTQLDQDRQRVQVGSLAPLDVQQDETQVASSKASLIAAQYTLVTDEGTLVNLITDSYRKWVGITLQPSEQLSDALQIFDLQDSWGKGMTKRPDLLQARLEVEQLGITLKYDRNQLYPELDLIGSYGYNGAGEDYNATIDQFGEANHPFYSIGGSISIPLSNAKARNNLKSDKSTLQQKLLTLKQLEQSILMEINNSVAAVRSDYEAVQASRQASVYAAAALDAEQKKYNVGKSTTFTVLQLQNTLTTDRGTEIRNIANYDEDIARLSQNQGTTLEDLNITVKVH